MYELIKALKSKTYMLFNLVFANNVILSCFFLFFVIYQLFNSCSYCTSFNPAAELVIPTEIPIKEAKGEIETRLLNTEVKMSEWSV